VDLADFTTLLFATTASSLPVAPDGEFVYEHTFADPFVDLATRLTLRPLPGIGGAGYVYALSALLVAAMVTGLLAIYRMVAVAIGFAERKSNFVAAVSHELKTPLTAIRMYGEMLRDGIVGSEAKRDEYYRQITAESERLSRLINNVLEFARLEKGTRSMSLTVGPIAPVIAEAVTLLRPHLEQAGFTLRVEVDDALPPARFERDALLQVLFNLVDNAVKYAAGAARAEIVLRAARAGDRIVLAVRDHGPGVPAEHVGKIFEPFYRGERELTRRSKGTGLGLALVRGLAEGMGATVLGRNAQDGGFEVEIGLVAAAG
jgi:signal transduction histidine kinase